MRMVALPGWLLPAAYLPSLAYSGEHATQVLICPRHLQHNNSSPRGRRPATTVRGRTLALQRVEGEEEDTVNTVYRDL